MHARRSLGKGSHVKDHDERPYVDTQTLTDTDTYIFEAIATLEFSGRLATRTEIASATNLDDETLDGALRALTGNGLLIAAENGGETTFEPARRDWSRAPEEPQGPAAQDSGA